jgi:hypothetical protein
MKGISTWVTVLSTPALLVPAALAGVLAFWLEMASSRNFRPTQFTDNSWHVSLIVLVTMSVLVAGFIGLLQPLRAGTKPDGRHFVAGMKDHTVTIFLGQMMSLLFLGFVTTNLFTEGAERTTFSTIFLLAPSLVLAPLLGTTALHPRRPLRAFRAVFERVTWDLHETARLLCGQILISVLTWIAFQGREGMQHLHVLARETSVLSFNSFPLTPSSLGNQIQAVDVLHIALTMITSTVFIMLYHRRVLNVPERPIGRTKVKS